MNPDKIMPFLSGEVEIAGYKLRRPTAGTVLSLDATNSPLLAKNLPELIEQGKLTALDAASVVAQYIILHSAPLAEIKKLAADPAAMEAKLYEAADKIAIDDVLTLAKEINAYLTKMQATRDWEVAGTGGVPFSPQSGQPSTLPKSPS
jgi:hypothetical protein